MINFMRPSKCYSGAVDSIVTPVAEELGRLGIEYKVGAEWAGASDVNVYSFFGDKYLDEVGGLTGITVHLAHGVADKDYRTADRMNKFDYCVVEGEFYRDKLLREEFSRNKMIIGGFPKFSTLARIERRTKIRGAQGGLINVLYAPTHVSQSGNNLCSLANKANGAVTEHLNDPKFLLIDSLHPVNRDSNGCTTERLVHCDVVVSDCSSVIYEAWHLGKPVVFLDFLVKNYVSHHYPNSAEKVIYDDGIGRHANSYEEAKKLIRDAYMAGITTAERLFLDVVSNAHLRKNSPRLIAESLGRLGGYTV